MQRSYYHDRDIPADRQKNDTYIYVQNETKVEKNVASILIELCIGIHPGKEEDTKKKQEAEPNQRQSVDPNKNLEN